MKHLLVIILTVSTIGNELNKVATINKLKKEAKEAYLKGDFETAITNYRILVDSFQVKDEKVLLNLANAQYKAHDTINALNNYRKVIYDGNNELKSVAYQQLGVIDAEKKQYKPALENFKQALKSNPANEEARYNYELLKKLLEEQEKQKQDQQDQNQENKDQQNQDQQNQENQEQQQQQQNSENQEGEDQQEQQQQENQEGEDEQEKKKPNQEGENQDPNQDEQLDPKTMEKLKEMNISEEKARMILEAMKNNEIQYLQQVKKKAKNRRRTNKPDW